MTHHESCEAHLTSWTTCGIMCVKQVVRMTPPAKHERQETNIRPRRALFRRRFAAATAPSPPPPASCTADAAAMHLKAMVGSMPATSEMAPRSTIATTFVDVTSMFPAVVWLGGEWVNEWTEGAVAY